MQKKPDEKLDIITVNTEGGAYFVSILCTQQTHRQNLAHQILIALRAQCPDLIGDINA